MTQAKKSRLFYVLSLVCFLLIISFTIITIMNVDQLIEKNNQATNTNDQIGQSIGYALSLGIMMALLIIYAVITAVPALYKIIVAIVNGYAVGIISIFFDAIYTSANFVFVVTTVVNNGFKIDYSMVWLLACTLFSALALVFDILAVSAKKSLRSKHKAVRKAIARIEADCEAHARETR